MMVFQQDLPMFSRLIFSTNGSTIDVWQSPKHDFVVYVLQWPSFFKHLKDNNHFLSDIQFFQNRVRIKWHSLYKVIKMSNFLWVLWNYQSSCFLEQNLQISTHEWHFPANIYLFKVNNRDTGKICSELTIQTPERRQWRFYRKFWIYFTPFSHVSIVDFEQVSFKWVMFLFVKLYFH